MANSVNKELKELIPKLEKGILNFKTGHRYTPMFANKRLAELINGYKEFQRHYSSAYDKKEYLKYYFDVEFADEDITEFEELFGDIYSLLNVFGICVIGARR